ncbi:Mur ligase family protein [Patescibacteria group bacterium]|nr:Mur ligase family protein [Patescibacteria group bacterium]MCL5091811.1 Mur ligase family protein [Patescibacteria group bacterium]
MSYQPNRYKRLFHGIRRRLAKHWLKRMPAVQIALTGSQGKTNTAAVLHALLTAAGPTVVTDPNLDTTFNVPITALKVRPGTRFALFELGVDHPGEMDQHLEITHPCLAVITGISPVHTDNEHFGSLEKLVAEKQKLMAALPKSGYAILNYDDKIVRSMATATQAQVLWYGSDPHHCHLWIDQIQTNLNGTSFTLHRSRIAAGFGWLPNQCTVTTKLIGKHHPFNLAAGLLTLATLQKIMAFNVSFARLLAVIKTIVPLPGRMSVEAGPLGTIVLNDSLRANPASTRSGLETLAAVRGVKGRKFAVLAEMGELADPETEHRQIGALVARLKIDYLVAIGPWQRYTAQTAIRSGMARENVMVVDDVATAAAALKPRLKSGDLIYLKGSLLRHVNRILLLLEGKPVDCRVTLCPFYHPCQQCRYLHTGYVAPS